MLSLLCEAPSGEKVFFLVDRIIESPFFVFLQHRHFKRDSHVGRTVRKGRIRTFQRDKQKRVVLPFEHKEKKELNKWHFKGFRKLIFPISKNCCHGLVCLSCEISAGKLWPLRVEWWVKLYIWTIWGRSGHFWSRWSAWKFGSQPIELRLKTHFDSVFKKKLP